MATLSIIIITYNEENNIGRCIRSVQEIADEVIVLDSFSSDRTTVIAAGLGAKCYYRAFSGYGEQRNAAAQLASHDYLLFLDADEYLSEELNKSILQEKQKAFPCDGYRVSRLTFYQGRWIHHGSWYPDRKLRLLRRGKGHWGSELVHESLKPDNDAIVGSFHGDLLHISFTSQENHVNKLDRYSTLAAKHMLQQGKKASRFRIVLAAPFTFFSEYFLQAGFLDGLPGFLIAMHSAYYTLLKYAKLRELSCKDFKGSRFRIRESSRTPVVTIVVERSPVPPSSSGCPQRKASADAAP